MEGLYILKEHNPVKESNVIAWAEWMEKADTVVKQEAIAIGISAEIPLGKSKVGFDECTLEGCRISTIFLGLDHNYGIGSPLLFETMIFGGHFDGERKRYSTWDEALRGHKRMKNRALGCKN